MLYPPPPPRHQRDAFAGITVRVHQAKRIGHWRRDMTHRTKMRAEELLQAAVKSSRRKLQDFSRVAVMFCPDD